MIVLFLLTVSAWALPWDDVAVPEDLSEQDFTWFIDENDYLYEYSTSTPFVLQSGDLVLNIAESDDERGEVEDDLWFETGDSDSEFGYESTLNIVTKVDTVNIPLHYENETGFSGSFNIDFHEGASLSAEGIEASASGDVTMNVTIPTTRGYYTIDTVALGEHNWPEVRPWVDCVGDTLFNKVLIARVLDTPYYEVRYSNYGGSIPYGYPADGYPLIRRDLTPSRFSSDEDLTIDLGTVFVSTLEGWPRYDETPGSYLPSVLEGDSPSKGHSLMVKVTNWGDETQTINVDPEETGFESFALRMKKIDTGTVWPAICWGNYWDLFGSQDFSEVPWEGEVYEWPMSPALSSMYWGGRFNNVDVFEGIPSNRTYSDEQNSFVTVVGENTFTFTWTPKEFETLGSIYPSPNEDNVDFLASQAWTVGSGRDNGDNNFPDIESPDLYQGSGVVMHLVSFDIPSSDLGGMNAFLPDYDFENESADIVSLEQMPSEDSIAGNLTYAALVDVPFDPVPYAVPLGPEASELASDELAIMPLHAFAFLTEDLMKDVDEDAYNEFVQALEEDTPLDIAFLENFRLFNFDAEGYKTDLIQLVESAGKEPTNYFRVVGNKYRVCVHFFAVLADTDEAGVEVKDGYFLISDGTKDESFNTSFAGTVAPAPEEDTPVSTSSGGGSCNVGAFPAAFGLLMMPLLFLLRR
jgi:hypothetical protein